MRVMDHVCETSSIHHMADTNETALVVVISITIDIL